MGLSDDQRAMLRMVAQREQGYEDIAALMGLSVDDVRAKVKDALDQLQSEGVEAPPLPPEPAPEPQAAKPAEPPREPEPTPPPVEPAAASKAEPTVQAAKTEPAAAATPPPASPPAAKKPREKGMGIAIAAGVAGAIVIVVLAVLLISNSGGDDSSTTTTNAAANPASEETPASETTGGEGAATGQPTEAALEPVGGGSASGNATFGRFKNRLALGVKMSGLEPTTEKVDSYTIWLAQSPQRMLPLASTEAKKGVINASFEVPTEVLAYLANETFKQIVVTKTQNTQLEAALKLATKEEKAPTYTGVAVAEGPVIGPIVGAASREEEEKAEAGE